MCRVIELVQVAMAVGESAPDDIMARRPRTKGNDTALGMALVGGNDLAETVTAALLSEVFYNLRRRKEVPLGATWTNHSIAK